MRNGAQGYSQKGPRPESASYYYSIPHLQVTGAVVHLGREEAMHGEAWLDHEWSSEYLDPQAQGWDWIGLNLDDGSALMAFRIRALNGSTRWAGGTVRDARGAARALEPSEIEWVPLQRWRSNHTGIEYPVRWSVRTAGQEYDLSPLMPDQENDTRATSGAIYWEGAVKALRGGREVGRGYLELTGYGRALKLQ
jgi:predicted secreted hydrolase